MTDPLQQTLSRSLHEIRQLAALHPTVPNRPDIDQHDPMIGSAAAAATLVRYATRHAPADGAAWLHLAVEALALVSHELLLARTLTNPPPPVRRPDGAVLEFTGAAEPRPVLPAPRQQIFTAITVLAAWLHDIDQRDGRIRWPTPKSGTDHSGPALNSAADDRWEKWEADITAELLDSIGRSDLKPTR